MPNHKLLSSLDCIGGFRVFRRPLASLNTHPTDWEGTPRAVHTGSFWPKAFAEDEGDCEWDCAGWEDMRTAVHRMPRTRLWRQPLPWLCTGFGKGMLTLSTMESEGADGPLLGCLSGHGCWNCWNGILNMEGLSHLPCIPSFCKSLNLFVKRNTDVDFFVFFSGRASLHSPGCPQTLSPISVSSSWNHRHGSLHRAEHLFHS